MQLNKQELQNLATDRFSLNKLYEVEVKEAYQIKTSKGSAA
jgi:hypothetical protein